jgi:ABC-2 type transport system permease protein
MSGFRAIFAKDRMEICRTWRIWVLPGLLLACAVFAPLMARFAKDLLASAAVEGGVRFEIPDPTWRACLVQWNDNLTQTGTLALIITLGGVISSERAQGVHLLVLTKSVSRAAYLAAKTCSAVVLIFLALAGATLVEHGIARLVFPDTQFGPVVALSATWFVQSLMWVAVLVAASSALDSAIAASAVGLGAWVLVSVAELWGPAARYSPAGLGTTLQAITRDEVVSWGWPVTTAAVVTVAFLGAGVVILRHREV